MDPKMGRNWDMGQKPTKKYGCRTIFECRRNLRNIRKGGEERPKQMATQKNYYLSNYCAKNVAQEIEGRKKMVGEIIKYFGIKLI
jgi:hypothetical protein